ncbi:uncharacterized protein LOC144110135 [Amblyomma americanum]
MPCSVLAVSWALLVAAMLPAPCRTRVVVGDREDPDRARAIELIKGRILADLGLASAPTGASSSGGQVALNKVHMEHMMRVYRRSLHRSPEEGGGGRGRERGRGRKGVARGSAKEVTHYYSFKNEGESEDSTDRRTRVESSSNRPYRVLSVAHSIVVSSIRLQR